MQPSHVLCLSWVVCFSASEALGPLLHDGRGEGLKVFVSVLGNLPGPLSGVLTADVGAVIKVHR